MVKLPHKQAHIVCQETILPSLFRFLVLCAILAGIAYGVMFALVLYVQPVEREISVRVPAQKLNP